MKRPIALRLGAAVALLGLALPTQAAVAHGNGSATRTYTASTDVIANPERGFYHHTETHYYADGTGYTPLDRTTLSNFRTQENVTQILRVFYLEKFSGQDKLDKAYLAKVQADFTTIRAAGVKAIVRFAYALPGEGWPPPTPYGDAPLARVLQQIKQLTPILRQNSDVIELVQEGFIGLWGEGYYTDYFSDPVDPSIVTDQNWADRKTVSDALLRALPRDRMIQVRTPYMKQRTYGVPTGTPGALTARQAYNGSPVARIGHHNDCFLASPDDYGTYLSDPIQLDKDFVAQDSKYLPQGGETCAVNSPRSDWPAASAEMAEQHFSFLNTDYNQDVLSTWGDAGITTAKQKLGYRFTLVKGTFDKSTRPRGKVSVSLDLRNDGWAAPYNPKKVQLIFQSDRHTYTVTLPTDPRRWAAGTTTTLTQQVHAPAVPGKYKLLLKIADPQLTNRPEYSIQLANQGTWQPTTGYNDLGQTITVTH